ncbi:hypothetical protein [Phormidium sp. CCY1219]|nr:hypothetical protein [Phormidium sp. CCY1219]MEB3831328.1 hypothetical protein [Phormidium sp. CCY1219]
MTRGTIILSLRGSDRQSMKSGHRSPQFVPGDRRGITSAFCTSLLYF